MSNGATEETNRLEEITPVEVSVVDKAANKRDFLVIKSADGTLELVDRPTPERIAEVVLKAAEAHKTLMGETSEAFKRTIDKLVRAAASGNLEEVSKISDSFWQLQQKLQEEARVVSAASNSNSTGAEAAAEKAMGGGPGGEKAMGGSPAGDKSTDGGHAAEGELHASLRAAGERLLKAASSLEKDKSADVSADIEEARRLLASFAEGMGMEEKSAEVAKAHADILVCRSPVTRLRKAAEMVLGLGGIEKPLAMVTVSGVEKAIAGMVQKGDDVPEPKTTKITADHMAKVVGALSTMAEVAKAVGSDNITGLRDLARAEATQEAVLLAKALDEMLGAVAKRDDSVVVQLQKRLDALERVAVSKALGGHQAPGGSSKPVVKWDDII